MLHYTLLPNDSPLPDGKLFGPGNPVVLLEVKGATGSRYALFDRMQKINSNQELFEMYHHLAREVWVLDKLEPFIMPDQKPYYEMLLPHFGIKCYAYVQQGMLV